MKRFSVRQSLARSTIFSATFASGRKVSAVYSTSYSTAVVTERIRPTILDNDIPSINTPTRERLTVDDIPKTNRSLPILGNTLEFLKDLSGFHRLLEKYSQEGDIIRMKAGPLAMVLMFDPELAGQVFQSSKFIDRPRLDAVNHFRQIYKIGTGIAFSNGHEWERPRSIANKTLLQPRIVQDFAAAIIENADLFVKVLQQEQGKPVTISKRIDDFTMDTIGKIAFGESFNALTGNQSELARSISGLLKGTQDLLFVPFPFYKYFETPAVKQLRKNYETLLDVGGKIIEKNKRMIEEPTGRLNYVRLLLNTKDESGEPLSKGEILGEMIDIIGAGQETTSRLLGWTVLALAKDEALQERIYEEIQKNVKNSNSDLTYELLMGKQMPVLTNTVKESLRLFPPATIYSRQAIDTEYIGQYELPKGTVVGISPWVLGRHPRLWENPLKFDPDRFSKPHHPFAWVPFGAGRRSCVGMRVALLETKILLVKLLESFKLKHNKAFVDPIPISRFTLCPDRDIVINLEQREKRNTVVV